MLRSHINISTIKYLLHEWAKNYQRDAIHYIRNFNCKIIIEISTNLSNLIQVLYQERATGGCLQKDDTTAVTHSWLNSSFNSEHRVCRRCTLYFTVANFRFRSIEAHWQKQRRPASQIYVCSSQKRINKETKENESQKESFDVM